MSRAFSTTAPKISSSDRSKILKQQTIYNNIRNNITKNICQTKGNKFGSINYCLGETKIIDPNDNSHPDCNTNRRKEYNISSAKIRSVSDYETLFDMTKGRAYCKPCNILLNKFDGTNGESSNTLYINPDIITIADTADNYCIGSKASGAKYPERLPCCDSGSNLELGTYDNINNPHNTGNNATSATNSCDQCNKTGMIFKVNYIGEIEDNYSEPKKKQEGFIPIPCFSCDKTCEPTSVIIDPYHKTFRAKCNSSFMGTDKPGYWVNRIRTVNPSVMSEYAFDSYSKKLTGFDIPKSLDIKIYPKNTIFLQNCSKYPQYNGIYVLDQDKYIVDNSTSKPVTVTTPAGPQDLVYSQWLQIDDRGKMTGRTIIPCIGSPTLNAPCLFSYVISNADLRCKTNPFQKMSSISMTWDLWNPLALAISEMFNQIYITNLFQFDASGFRPFIVRIPYQNGVNMKNDPIVISSWKDSGIANLLVDQPIGNTFSAQYPIVSGALRVPFGEDIITMKTLSE